MLGSFPLWLELVLCWPLIALIIAGPSALLRDLSSFTFSEQSLASLLALVDLPLCMKNLMSLELAASGGASAQSVLLLVEGVLAEASDWAAGASDGGLVGPGAGLGGGLSCCLSTLTLGTLFWPNSALLFISLAGFSLAIWMASPTCLIRLVFQDLCR